MQTPKIAGWRLKSVRDRLLPCSLSSDQSKRHNWQCPDELRVNNSVAKENDRKLAIHTHRAYPRSALSSVFRGLDEYIVLKKFFGLSIGALLLTSILVACGGGGSGGPAAGGAGSNSSTNEQSPVPESTGLDSSSGISFRLVAPAAINDVGFDGVSPNGVALQIAASVPVGPRAGRLVYGLAQMPDALYGGPVLYEAGATADTFKILLGSAITIPAKEGKYVGSMKLYICVDVPCESQLANLHPLAIPYSVEIKPGLQISAEALNITAGFGGPTTPSEVSVSLPDGATDWSISTTSFHPEIEYEKAGNKLIVKPLAARPGVYSEVVHIATSVPRPAGGLPIGFIKTLTITYTIEPSANPYVLTPASASFTLPLNDSALRLIQFSVLGDGTGSFSRVGIRYGSHPDAASGNPQLDKWIFSDGSRDFVSPCGSSQNSHCLPVGTYLAAIQLRHTSATGVNTDFEFPVTMTISP